MIRVATEPGLACWASYLVNGDASGISDDERADADAFAAFCEGSIVSISDEEPWIGCYYGPGKSCGLQCEMITYVIHYVDSMDAGEATS